MALASCASLLARSDCALDGEFERQRIDGREHVALLHEIACLNVARNDPAEDAEAEFGLDAGLHRSRQ